MSGRRACGTACALRLLCGSTRSNPTDLRNGLGKRSTDGVPAKTDVTAVIGFFCNQSTCGRHASPVLSLQMNPELVFFKRNANRAGTAKPRSLSDSTDFCIPLRHAQSRHIPQRCSSRVFHEHFACSGLEGLAQNLILTPFLWFRNRQRADNGRYVGLIPVQGR